ncbi:hypothetical protein ANANG_G00004820 [Anguilla anguilla]|uniref:Uncharacterized protein n=1 Tax=Anguilla anguilla TaxID=7936 RepID=A0A9D3S937_ANGAN|nr:hypothetical protein ANANG_G00004820 [Anguilla anguilla]
MTKMTAAYLGVLVLVTCFSTLVRSNATMATPAANHTVTMAHNSTMMLTSAYTNANNFTTPSGAVSFTRSGPFSILLPVAMAASLVCSRS